MDPDWDRIGSLEKTGEHNRAIKSLEEVLLQHPGDEEAVIRLGFHYWYVTVEHDLLQVDRSAEDYGRSFMQLFRQYEAALSHHADFCWAFGLGMSMFWFEFPGATKEVGDRLLAKAKELDEFWRKFPNVSLKEEIAKYGDRGIWTYYYSGLRPEFGRKSSGKHDDPK